MSTSHGTSLEPRTEAFHGGASFEAIGVSLNHLERAHQVVTADVLDAWFDPSPRVIERIQEYLPLLARSSPPVRAAGLVAAIARRRGVPEACVVTGCGSSGLIFACLPHLLRPDGRALILDPMYGEYQFLLESVLGSDVVRFGVSPQNEFRVERDKIAEAVKRVRPDLIVVVNPNSPTGVHWPRAELTRFLDDVPDSINVVVDETYVEYAGSAESVEREAAQRRNLVVIKSMSKVYALSGMRVGYLVANPALIQRLAPWVPPWSVSLPAQVAAIEALNDPLYYERRYQETRQLRDDLVRDLAAIDGIRVYGSVTNFLLIEVKSSSRIVNEVARSGVYVRNCDSMTDRFKDRFIRIAVRNGDENQRIAESLRAATRRFA